jgi:chaperone BCS1
MFSPAEIQGFLLKRKKEPRRAVLEVGVWVEGMREVKRRGGKVVTVQ